MRFVVNANAVLVYTACDHTDTRYDRFGDEVCRSCGQTVVPNAVPPREDLYCTR